MTAAELAELNGLLAVEAAARANCGDPRDKSEIVDAILREVRAPDIEPAMNAIALMMARRVGRADLARRLR